MSRRKKALVRELRRGIDDWHLFMDDAKGECQEETSRTRKDINRARKLLFELKRKNTYAEFSDEEECCVF